MSLIYNATFDKNTRKLSFEDKAGNEIYSFIVPERGPAVDSVTKPLTFKATQNGSSVTLKKNGTTLSDSFQTSRDGGNTWADYTLNTAITLNTGEEVSFRAKEDRTSAQKNYAYYYFMMEGKIEAWHNVMSMLRTNDFATCKYMVDYAFFRLFKGCTSLTKAPVLPAIICYAYCYSNMFNGCTSLAEAPELPATALDRYCYKSMFEGCTSLTKAPVLPATALNDSCYSYMFKSCTSLTEAPALPVTKLKSGCYSNMFNGCTSLTKAPELPATTLAERCYHSMFQGCQSLTKAPVLPATTLASNCYTGMFNGCSSLNEVRCKMPSTISAVDIPTYTGDGSDSNNPAWLDGVSATGTFYTNADANWPSGASGIPTGWNRVPKPAPTVDDVTKPLTFRATLDDSTVKLTKSGSPSGDFQVSFDGGTNWVDYTIGTVIRLNIGDEVSFRTKSSRTSLQTMQNYFYFDMWGKIEAWHNVMSLYRTGNFDASNNVVSYAFYSLFYNCTSLTKAPVLPATMLTISCYDGMFQGCQSLTKAPALPATTLAEGCYYSMFSGCQSLKEVRIAATKTASHSLEEWLYGVSSTGDFYCDPNATIFPSGASGIPQNWTRHNIADYPTT